MFDKHGQLLYVGSTRAGHRRMKQHTEESPWAWDVAVTKWEHFDSMAEAKQAEINAIANEQPRYNVKNRTDANGSTNLNVRLTHAEKDALENLAKDRGTSMTGLVRELAATRAGTPARESAGTPGGEAPTIQDGPRGEFPVNEESNEFKKRVKQLKARGLTTPLAKKQAAQEV